MLNVEHEYSQVIVTEYGGHDGRLLKTYVFDEEEDGYKYGGWSGPDNETSYPVESAPEQIRKAAEEKTGVEIIDREVPIRSAECTECGMLTRAESEESDVKIEGECPMCGEVEVEVG